MVIISTNSYNLYFAIYIIDSQFILYITSYENSQKWKFYTFTLERVHTFWTTCVYNYQVYLLIKSIYISLV